MEASLWYRKGQTSIHIHDLWHVVQFLKGSRGASSGPKRRLRGGGCGMVGDWSGFQDGTLRRRQIDRNWLHSTLRRLFGSCPARQRIRLRLLQQCLWKFRGCDKRLKGMARLLCYLLSSLHYRLFQFGLSLSQRLRCLFYRFLVANIVPCHVSSLALFQKAASLLSDGCDNRSRDLHLVGFAHRNVLGLVGVD